jgi:glycosyltransferase involved in cell wall biosynthesis
MQVSVAMATYNGERFLQEQLDSLAAQTLLPSELVVGDDGSEDRTLDILAEFAKTAPFAVRVRRNAQRLGTGDNFLETALGCSGELIAFCDQDDVWLPQKLERCAAILANYPEVALVAHASEITDGSLRPVGIDDPSFGHSRRIGTMQFPVQVWPLGHTIVFRRSVVWRCGGRRRVCSRQMAGGYEIAHDHWIPLCSLILGDIVLLPDVLARWRRHGGNSSRVRDTRLAGATAKALSTDSEDYRHMAEDYHDWAVHFRGLAVGPDREAFAAAAERCEHLANIFVWRSRLYCQDSGFLSRMSSIVNMLRGHAYASRWHGGLGSRGMAKDLLTLVFPLLVQQHGRG